MTTPVDARDIRRRKTTSTVLVAVGGSLIAVSVGGFVLTGVLAAEYNRQIEDVENAESLSDISWFTAIGGPGYVLGAAVGLGVGAGLFLAGGVSVLAVGLIQRTQLKREGWIARARPSFGLGPNGGHVGFAFDF